MRLALAFLGAASAATAQTGPDPAQVSTLFADRCVVCHAGEDAPLGLRLDTHAGILAGSANGPVAIAGDPSSPILQRLRGEAQPQMPLDGPPFLTEVEISLVSDWIMAGMPAGIAAETPAPERRRPAPGADVLWPDVEPVFLKTCAKCHSDNSKLGAPPEGLRLDSLDNVLAGGERVAVVPGQPAMSEVWRRITGLAQPRMPHDGPPWVPDEDIRLIGDWIAQGARDAAGMPAAIPVGGEVRLRGVMTGAQEIDGAVFVVDAGTRIDGRPRQGGAAEMRGVIQPDGSVRATRLRDR